jgi:hypothetical protein
VPLTFPKCISCMLTCPGYENCEEPEIRWLWQGHHKHKSLKKPLKIFTPYTERCAESFIASELEEPFYTSHALGSNSAPRAARAQFLARRLSHIKLIEFIPRVTLWRIGMHLRIQKSYLRFHKHAVDSEDSRLFFLKRLMETSPIFIYHQDMETLIKDTSAFDAFLGALTGYLESQGQTQLPPSDFPKNEAWIAFPKSEMRWFK